MMKGIDMNIVEKIEMRKKSYMEFDKFKSSENVGILIPHNMLTKYDNLGKDLISEEVCESLLEVRSIHHSNVVNKKLNDYDLPEWIVCLEEEILLEYAIPIFSRTLCHYPMLSGMNNEWEVLYLITRINHNFWQDNTEWNDYYKLLIKKVIDGNEIKDSISQGYLVAFSEFIMSM